jgi:hypothetical protein
MHCKEIGGGVESGKADYRVGDALLPTWLPGEAVPGEG